MGSSQQHAASSGAGTSDLPQQLALLAQSLHLHKSASTGSMGTAHLPSAASPNREVQRGAHAW
jgi:hypothetical protein